MRRLEPVVCSALALGFFSLNAGCGLVVDADRFRQPDDNAVNGSITFMLSPERIFEGSGGTPSEGQGVLLYLTSNAPTEVTSVIPDDPRVTCGTPVRSADGRSFAVRCWIAPFFDLAESETESVSLTLSPGGSDVSVTLTVDGLDELSLSGTRSTSTLRPLYSSITTTADVVLTGTTTAKLAATGVVDIQHSVSVAADEEVPGPGGLAGAMAGEPGPGERGGGAGESVSSGCAGGGGGAGALEVGGAGSGADGGQDGPMRPVRLAGLGGHGGGGGGRSGAFIGKGGGGGGGVLWLQGAVVRIESTLTARGGDGGSAARPGCGQDGSAAGGGGAGGAIFVRAKDVLLGAGTVDVTGGTGGTGAESKAGGDGSPGWIRIDAPDASLTVTAPDAWRGPAWILADPIVAPETSLSFMRPADEPLSIRIDGRGLGVIEPTADAWPAPATAGRHEMCLVLPSGAGAEEAETCIFVAVVL